MCWKFFFAVIASSLGSGFQHGYHTGIINVPAEIFQEWIQRLKTERVVGGSVTAADDVMTIWSTAVAMFPVGGILGGCLTGYFSDRCGRKNSLLLNNLIVIAALTILSLSKTIDSFELFVFGRFLAGINAGLNCGLCQIYLIEIAPDEIRGAVGGFYQAVITTSIMLSQVSSMVFGDKENWHFMFLVAFIPAIFQLFSLPFCPESPKYLLLNKDEEQAAEDALRWLRGTDDVQEEMETLKAEDNMVKRLHTFTLKRIFTNGALKTPLTVCLVLNIGQQLCGINTVVYFSSKTFGDMGFSPNTAVHLILGIGVAFAVASFICIAFVDRIGRQLFLRIGFFGMGLDTVALTIALIMTEPKDDSSYMKYFAVMFMFLLVVLFSLGVGPIAWFITSEIFNHGARTLAVSLTVSANWFANFLVGQSFLPLQSALGYYIYMVFVVLDCFFYFYTLLHLPETSKKSAKEIIEMYHY
ncbi:hypothetical protein MTP99_010058 [Tenebrio molitor]|nr:hypothetical protein MTP99_010058 [Tenebrio molitor]CAH1368592.1 unnamed protein product [Tenebrio molitor]